MGVKNYTLAQWTRLNIDAANNPQLRRSIEVVSRSDVASKMNVSRQAVDKAILEDRLDAISIVNGKGKPSITFVTKQSLAAYLPSARHVAAGKARTT